MKRSRNSKLSIVQKRKSKSKSKQSDDYDETEVSWSGFGSGIPKFIFFDILLRFPLRSILICRYVCKTWFETVSDPEFAKLHYQKSQFQLMLRTNDSKHISRTLFLVEVEHQELSNGCLEYGSDDFCDPLTINLDTKFLIPLRDAKMVLDELMTKKLKANSKRRPSIPARPTFDKFGVVNSCNGLLCLKEPINGNPFMICNPITGVFVKIPEIPVIEKPTRRICSGFGFNRSTNQYKVVRMYSGRGIDPHTGKEYLYGNITEVYTFGKGSWTYVGEPPRLPFDMKCPTYLNGAVHWFCCDYGSAYSIVSFDFESELFQILPVPRLGADSEFDGSEFNDISIGVFNDCLCICDQSYEEAINIWVMNDFGVKDSWTKTISVSLQGVLFGSFQVIKCYENDAVLMFHPWNILIYHDPKGSDRHFKIRGPKTSFEAFAHVPSLISLKDILIGTEMEVLNVNARCGRFKLREEKVAYSLEEEDAP